MGRSSVAGKGGDSERACAVELAVGKGKEAEKEEEEEQEEEEEVNNYLYTVLHY